MTPSPMHPRSAGEILDHAFRLYRRHFGPMIVTALITVLPLGLTSAGAGLATGEGLGLSIGLLAAVIAGVLLWAVSWGALTHAGHLAVSGREPRVGEALREGFRRLPALALFWILLYLLLVVVLVLPVSVLAGIGAVALQFIPEGALSVVAAAVGGLLLLAVVLALGAWFAATQAIAIPTIVIERVGAIRGIRRASALSKGSRIRISILVVTCWLLTVLPTIGVLALFGMTHALWNPDAVATLSNLEFFVQQISGIGVSALVVPFLTTVSVVIYYDQLVRREGLDIDLATSGGDVAAAAGGPTTRPGIQAAAELGIGTGPGGEAP